MILFFQRVFLLSKWQSVWNYSPMIIEVSSLKVSVPFSWSSDTHRVATDAVHFIVEKGYPVVYQKQVPDVGLLILIPRETVL